MKAPQLDKRTRADVLAQARILAGNPMPPVSLPPGWLGYVPDWTVQADPGDPAHRFLESFARLAELLIERLNGVPRINFLSFLDLAGVEWFPGAAAAVPVTFVVSKRALLGGTVPAGTRVATTQTKHNDARVFETVREFYASRARLQRIVAVHPAADRAVVLPEPVLPATAASLTGATAVRAFTDAEAALVDVAHVLYLASEPLFGRKAAVDVSVVFQVDGGVFPSEVVWKRFDKGAAQWVDLPPPMVGTSLAGRVTLTFLSLADVAKTTVDGVEDFWLAGHFIGDPTVDPPLAISSLTGSAGATALPTTALDAAFYNSAPLDTSKPFSPFGPRPAYADAFYFASDTAFAPTNESVGLTFAIRPYVHAVLQAQFAGLPAGGLTLRTVARWQYLNTGGEWVDLAQFDHSFTFAAASGAVTRVSSSPATGAGEGVFVGTADGDASVHVNFGTFPSDIGTHTLHGVESHWLRVLLVSENPYGHDGVLNSTATTPRFIGPLFIPPRIERVIMTAVPRAVAVPMTRVKTLNNFAFRDEAASVSFMPFVSVARHEAGGFPAFGIAPALYLGFDRQLEREAFISLFVDLAGPASSLTSPLESGGPVVAWEYWSALGWRPLDVDDATLNFTTSGTAAFVAPHDAVPAALFPRIAADADLDVASRWWLRARLAAGRYDHPPAVQGVYLNTVPAENRTTSSEVVIGSSNAEPDQTFALVKGPVLSGDVWVRETERPTAGELRDLDVEHAVDRDERPPPEGVVPNVRDVPGDDLAKWVRWRRVPNFRLSGPRSRHYLLDSVAAIVRFGDGLRGLIPAPGRNNLVIRDFQTGGGAAANQETGALSVKELKTSLPFIDKVFNVQPASAGASPWTVAQLEEFGPQALKNRGRSVTTEDYEWMVRQRFSDVARVRCIAVREPGPGGALVFKAGAVTCLVVPWSSEARPQPSQGLVRSVREFLAHCVLTNIAADVHVKGPDYVAVDVAAELVPTRPEFALVVARKAQAALDAFLHPLTGGEDLRGYGFGRAVHLSEVHAVLERIEEVDHVESARFVAAPALQVLAITGDRLASSGVHRITVL